MPSPSCHLMPINCLLFRYIMNKRQIAKRDTQIDKEKMKWIKKKMTKNSIDVSVCSSTSTTATGSAYCSGYIFAQNVWILRVSEWWRTNAIYSEERAIYNESHWQLVLLLDTFVWLWLAYYNKFVVSLSPFVYLTFRSSLAFFSCKLFFSRLFSFVLLLLTHLIHVTFRHPQPFKVCTMFIQYIKHGIYVIRGRNIDVTIF